MLRVHRGHKAICVAGRIVFRIRFFLHHISPQHRLALSSYNLSAEAVVVAGVAFTHQESERAA